MSHKSRAFIITQDGLPGFVEAFDFCGWLSEIEASDTVHEFSRSQVIDVPGLIRELQQEKSKIERKRMMYACYPGLYVEGLIMTDRFDEIDAFKEDCKKSKDGNYLEYSTYVHGYLIPFFEYMREMGILKQGK